MLRRPPRSTLIDTLSPYTTRFRAPDRAARDRAAALHPRPCSQRSDDGPADRSIGRNLGPAGAGTEARGVSDRPTYDEVVLGRRSIRGYLDKPVARELVEEVMALAIRSPTTMKTHPWHFHCITGNPLTPNRGGKTNHHPEDHT